MSSETTGALYDALCGFETRLRGGGAYPVHKSLRFVGRGLVDIYDWIASEIELPAGGDILDAGCGVGFGTARLATLSGSCVTGISVSAQEIEQARRNASRSSCAAQLTFLQRSYDHLPGSAFDLVVAVESLKHSTDLAASLRSILCSIKPGGQLVVVEDVVVDREQAEAQQRLAEAWSLVRLYDELDYREALGSVLCRIVDLSAAVPRRGSLAIGMKLAAVRGLLALPFHRTGRALEAFRGGLYMDRLYRSGAMAYKVFVCRLDGLR
ncbi:MAG TPA: class I SAM-dependent methyltransferase [Gammaproteobacteria bacterium]|nr:class I SAM-dependent methyltransferase [Gammaproteobacteria bacterium]